MTVKYANFNTVGIEQNLDYKIFDSISGLIWIGSWEWGDKSGFASLPQYKVEASDGDRALKDAQRANGLLVVTPSACYEAFSTARANNVFMLKKWQELSGKGYKDQALVEAIAKTVGSAIAELDLTAAQLWTQNIKLQDAQAKIEGDFPDTGENEAQQTAFDIAIVQRIAPPDVAESAQIQQGMLPARFNDARLIAALYRTPHALSGLDVATTDALRKLYAATAWPRTTEVLALCTGMMTAAQSAICSAACTLEKLNDKDAPSVFSKIRHGDWIASKRSSITMDAPSREKKIMIRDIPAYAVSSV